MTEESDPKRRKIASKVDQLFDTFATTSKKVSLKSTNDNKSDTQFRAALILKSSDSANSQHYYTTFSNEIFAKNLHNLLRAIGKHDPDRPAKIWVTMLLVGADEVGYDKDEDGEYVEGFEKLYTSGYLEKVTWKLATPKAVNQCWVDGDNADDDEDNIYDECDTLDYSWEEMREFGKVEIIFRSSDTYDC